MSKLTLLTIPPSPHNTKVRLALKLKGLEYTTVTVDFTDRKEVVKRSGQPLTPVLLDGDRVVYDSFGIIRYLDANWPEPRLFSADREKQQEIQSWERFAVADLGGALSLVAGQAFSGKIDDDATKKAEALLSELPQRIEEALVNTHYLMGEQPNAADLTVGPFLNYVVAPAVEFPEGTPMRFVSERLGLAPSFSRTHTWVKRVLELDSAPVT